MKKTILTFALMTAFGAFMLTSNAATSAVSASTDLYEGGHECNAKCKKDKDGKCLEAKSEANTDGKAKASCCKKDEKSCHSKKAKSSSKEKEEKTPKSE